MLANYLKSVRQSRVLASPQVALGQLGANWQVSGDGASIEKQFVFTDFHEASNFIQRYTDYCSKLNSIPQWSNVYNKVTVKLSDPEFKSVSSKEVSLGQYLDMVHRTNIHDIPSFEDVMDSARLSEEVGRNDKGMVTSLFLEDQIKASNTRLIA